MANPPAADEERRAWAADTARCLAMLSEREASALRLAYADGMSAHEIARWLKATRPEVETAIATGLRRLGDLLAGIERA